MRMLSLLIVLVNDRTMNSELQKPFSGSTSQETETTRAVEQTVVLLTAGSMNHRVKSPFALKAVFSSRRVIFPQKRNLSFCEFVGVTFCFDDFSCFSLEAPGK